MNTHPNHQKLYQIAEAQAGLFTARQAQRAGFSFPLLSHHVKTGKFLHLRRGLYRLADFPEQPHADLFAAWLSAGEKAVLSHDSALALYGLSDHLPAQIHLTIPRTASHRLAGLRLHTGKLTPQEITQRQGLPVTSLPRTLTDLVSNGLASELITQAIRQALERGLVEAQTLQEVARLEQYFNQAMEKGSANDL
jgi:predicted transcriptional regulator of viral defense system